MHTWMVSNAIKDWNLSLPPPQLLDSSEATRFQGFESACSNWYQTRLVALWPKSWLCIRMMYIVSLCTRMRTYIVLLYHYVYVWGCIPYYCTIMYTYEDVYRIIIQLCIHMVMYTVLLYHYIYVWGCIPHYCTIMYTYGDVYHNTVPLCIRMMYTVLLYQYVYV